MIDEKKLIGRLEKLGWVYADYYPDETAIHKQRKKSVAYDDVIGSVNQLAEEHKGGWIPVSERLPETNESVLCWAKSTARGGDVCFVGSCHNGFWFLQSSADTHSFPGQYEVVAWQPLPEPYRKEEEKDSTPYGITVEEAGKALEKLSEAIRKATTADSIELEKRNIEQNPSINFFQKRKLIKQLDEMKGAL